MCCLVLMGNVLVAQEPVLDLSAAEIRQLMQFKRVPLPADPGNRWADNAAAAALGQKLFFSTRFSANGEIGCVTCHQPALGFADGRERAVGLAEGERHTPSLWDTAFNRWFFWDGRADSLWSQALQPFENPREMGLNRNRVVLLLHQSDPLRHAYEAIFGALPDLSDVRRFPRDAMPMPNQAGHPWAAAWGGMSESDRDLINGIFANIGKAIAAYERTLIAPTNGFDRFLTALATDPAHATTQMPPAAVRGARLFVGKGRCNLCHVGSQFSDGTFHQTGVPARDGSFPRDAGRYAGVSLLLADPFNSAGRYSDDRQGERAQSLAFLQRRADSWGQFKTPNLRQSAQHPPYMHGGQLPDLAAVVRFYNTLEGRVNNGHHVDPLLVPLGLTPAEEADLVAFLASLSVPPPRDNPWFRPPSPEPSRKETREK
ncbi:cytochrome-c peroxidase [Acanthopleuribacter pedis]|nr:cytochrome c peroxidase [Acanthopleuribacter pedis]